MSDTASWVHSRVTAAGATPATTRSAKPVPSKTKMASASSSGAATTGEEESNRFNPAEFSDLVSACSVVPNMQRDCFRNSARLMKGPHKRFVEDIESACS